MNNNKTFNEAKAKNLQTLKQYVPIVARVHGKSHPEFYDVHKVFDELNEKLNLSDSEIPKLDEEFAKLRKITNEYTVPNDVCESYEAVYNMLEEMDKAYKT